MEKLNELLLGVFLLKPKVFEDSRGIFIKTYNKELFSSIGINFIPTEEFFSISHKNVLRGMHFQASPHAHDKIVYCMRGRVLDVIVDLRSGSSFGRSVSIELSASNRHLVYIPKGFAHGFLSLEDDSVMVYQTNYGYEASSDRGVRWDSFGFSWPAGDFIISPRDLGFPSLAETNSCF